MQVKIKAIENGKIPEYKTDGSAGADCFARLNEQVIVKHNEIITIPLGFAVEVPRGYEMQIRGRSGIARKNGVQVFNSPGTIDSDYRGEVGAILYNASSTDFIVQPFDRIAQAIICPVVQAEWVNVEKLSETTRGIGGFGSTGINENAKFYEPFKKLEEVEKYLNHKVIVDNYREGEIVAVQMNDVLWVGKRFPCIEVALDNGKNEWFSTLQAFTRITVDGHRFGKEMEMKGGEK